MLSSIVNVLSQPMYSEILFPTKVHSFRASYGAKFDPCSLLFEVDGCNIVLIPSCKGSSMCHEPLKPFAFCLDGSLLLHSKPSHFERTHSSCCYILKLLNMKDTDPTTWA
jgi:hypothetical protein